MNLSSEQKFAEALCQRIAGIMGEQSAAAQAIRDLNKRRAAGQVAWIESSKGMWLVGSKPLASTHAESADALE